MTEDAFQTVATPTEGETRSIVNLRWNGSDGAGEDLTAYTVELVGKRIGDVDEFTAIAGTKANQVTNVGEVAFDFAPVSQEAGSSGTYLCQMRRTEAGDTEYSQEMFQVVVRKSAAAA